MNKKIVLLASLLFSGIYAVTSTNTAFASTWRESRCTNPKQMSLNQEFLAAVKQNQQNTAQLLLEKGAEPTAQTADQENALHLAVMEGHWDLAKFLMNYIERNTKLPTSMLSKMLNAQESSMKRTVLHWAIWHNNLDMVNFVLAKGNVEIDLKDCNGKTALDLAHDKKESYPKIYDAIIDNI